MYAVIVAQIDDFLPIYGLTWQKHVSQKQLRLLHIADTRNSSRLAEWLSYNLPTHITLITNYATLRSEVSTLIDSLVRPLVDDILYESIKETDLLPEIGATGHEGKLLHPIVNLSRAYFSSVYPDFNPTGVIDYHCPIGDVHTTLAPEVGLILGIFPNPTLPSSMNLTAFFRNTRTPMGKRRLPGFLSHPLIDPETIRNRSAFIFQMNTCRSLRLKIQNICLSSFGDIDAIIYRLLTAPKLRDQAMRSLCFRFPVLYDSLEGLFSLVAILEGGQEFSVRDKYLVPLKEMSQDLVKLRDLITTAFDIEALRDPESPVILNSSLISAVDHLTQKLGGLDDLLEDCRAKIEKKLGAKVKIVQIAPEIRGFRVPRSIEVSQKYSIVKVNKNETIFTTPEMKKINTGITEIKSDCRMIEMGYVKKIVEVASTYIEPLKTISDFIGNLDILCSIAQGLSILPSTWLIPEIVSGVEAMLHIEEGKHPLLEIQDGLKGYDENVVPNSVFLGKDKMLLVTGPNMGGKSTFAKQAGLIAYLGQIGCLVPAKKCVLTPFDIFWTRAGADDSPSRGLSTFMAEAVETALMIQALIGIKSRSSGGKALVIVDELGRGTSASDGLAFAGAVMKFLISLDNCLAIFATHFHELADMDITNLRPMKIARNSGDQKTATFKVEEGVESDSDGILLAKMYGFPASLVQEALEFATRFRPHKNPVDSNNPVPFDSVAMH